MLCFCVNAGPAFVLSIVGSGYLKSSYAGLLLLGGQLLSCCLLGLLCRGKSCKKSCPQKPTKRIGSPGKRKILSSHRGSAHPFNRSRPPFHGFYLRLCYTVWNAFLFCRVLSSGRHPARGRYCISGSNPRAVMSFPKRRSLFGDTLSPGLGRAQRAIPNSFPFPGACPFPMEIPDIPACYTACLPRPVPWGLTKLFPPSPLAEETFSKFFRDSDSCSSRISCRRNSSCSSLRCFSSQPHPGTICRSARQPTKAYFPKQAFHSLNVPGWKGGCPERNLYFLSPGLPPRCLNE